MRKVAYLPVVLIALLSLSSISSASAATAKSGAPCKSLGSTSTASGKTFTCTKSGNKLLWDKGVTAGKITPSKSITIGTARSTQVLIPGNLKTKVPAPLLVALHGFTATPKDLLALVDLATEANKRGVVLALPSGTKNKDGLTFWNATESCCDFYNSAIDDSKYLMDLVDQIGAKVSIDPQRIYFMGHSNGGFMSYTMACRYSDRIAAIVSLEGSTFKDTAECKPASHVSILHITGTADDLIQTMGGDVFGDVTHPYPSAQDAVFNWAVNDGCSALLPMVENSQKFDFETQLPGNETSKKSYECPKGLSVEMWTIDGGKHLPTVNSAFTSSIFDFLLAHKK